MQSRLTAAGVSGDLMLGLAMGWQFGTAAMIAFGVIVTSIFVRRFRGEAVSAFAALVIGIAYLAYGGCAFAASRDAFVVIFVVPAVLLIVAASDAARGAA